MIFLKSCDLPTSPAHGLKNKQPKRRDSHHDIFELMN